MLPPFNCHLSFIFPFSPFSHFYLFFVFPPTLSPPGDIVRYYRSSQHKLLVQKIFFKNRQVQIQVGGGNVNGKLWA
jgi:hypothetical protein